jgi:hypothetical protein
MGFQSVSSNNHWARLFIGFEEGESFSWRKEVIKFLGEERTIIIVLK